jgi:hypothetical protein
MSIADNFDHDSDAIFVRAYDARAARRQFQVSIVLVLVLALAAVALGMLTQLAPPIANGRSSSLNASSQRRGVALYPGAAPIFGQGGEKILHGQIFAAPRTAKFSASD